MPDNDKTYEEKAYESSLPSTNADAWEQIRNSLKGLRFGTVQLIVQDGVIVQIDRTEKRRLHRLNRPDTT